MKFKLLPAVAALLLSGLCAEAAVVDTLSVSSPYLATPDDVLVVVPDAALSGDQHFPTVYMLNGFAGDHTNWLAHAHDSLLQLADEYGMILVMPDGRDSWYWDSPKEPELQMESFFVNSLVPYIDAKYPTLPTADKRAITGLSMGGHGALWLSIRHSDIWGNAGSMSGGVDIRPFPKSWSMYKHLGPRDENPDVWASHTVINIVDQIKPGAINITVDCGVDDFFYEVNKSLHQALLDAKIDHDFTSRPGAHSWAYWTNSIKYHLLFFNENFNK
jgi:S-formylglutathione hydrolase FrmB